MCRKLFYISKRTTCSTKKISVITIDIKRECFFLIFFLGDLQRRILNFLLAKFMFQWKMWFYFLNNKNNLFFLKNVWMKRNGRFISMEKKCLCVCLFDKNKIKRQILKIWNSFLLTHYMLSTKKRKGKKREKTVEWNDASDTISVRHEIIRPPAHTVWGPQHNRPKKRNGANRKTNRTK